MLRERRDQRVAIGAADAPDACAARRRRAVKSMSGAPAVDARGDAIDVGRARDR